MTSRKPLPHRDVFENLGETQVRFEFAGRGDDIAKAAETWLVERQQSRDAEASAKRDAREEETLAIARQALANSERANANSERANKIAAIAIICSAIATVIATVTAVIYAPP